MQVKISAVILLLLCASAFGQVSTPCTNTNSGAHFQYYDNGYGGQMPSTVTSYFVWYGGNWSYTGTPGLRIRLARDFVAGMWSSIPWGVVQNYCDASGNRPAYHLLNNSADNFPGTSYGTTPTVANVDSLVQDTINLGYPDAEDVIYWIMLSDDVTNPRASTTCAYHSAIYSSGGHRVKYIVVPFGHSSCYKHGGGPYPNDDAQVSEAAWMMWHEASETVTDPNLNLGNPGWWDSSYGEIADHCEGVTPSTLGTSQYNSAAVSVVFYSSNYTDNGNFTYNQHNARAWFIEPLFDEGYQTCRMSP